MLHDLTRIRPQRSLARFVHGLWCPDLAAPGRDVSPRALRLLAGGLEDGHDVFAGWYKRATNSINASLLRRSRSLRLDPTGNEPIRK